MRRHNIHILVILILLACLAGGCVEKQPNDEQFRPEYVFDINALPTIILTIDVDDWNKYLHNLDVNINTRKYVPISFTFEKGDAVFVRENVGMRPRGHYSRMRPEGEAGQPHDTISPQWHPAHFGIKFTEYEDGRRFFGCDRLILKSFMRDKMYCRDIYCYDLLRRFGVWVAPRASYCRLFIKIRGEEKAAYFGIYEMIEGVRKEYLESRYKRNFYSDTSGNLWKANPTIEGTYLDNADNIEYLGIDDEYKSYPYSLRTNKNDFPKAAAELMSFVSQLKQLKNGSNELKDWLYNNVDVDQFLRYLAVNVVVGSWDDYWYNGSNYYFYFDSKGKFHLIPYDYEFTLGMCWEIDAGNRDVLNWGRDKKPLLVDKIFSIDDFLQLYKSYVLTLAQGNNYFAFAASQERISDWQKMIAPYLANDIASDEFQVDALSDETLPGGYDYKLLSANQHDNFFIVKMQSIEQQLSATR